MKLGLCFFRAGSHKKAGAMHTSIAPAQGSKVSSKISRKRDGVAKIQGRLCSIKRCIFFLRDCGAFVWGSLLNKKFRKAASSALGRAAGCGKEYRSFRSIILAALAGCSVAGGQEAKAWKLAAVVPFGLRVDFIVERFCIRLSAAGLLPTKSSIALPGRPHQPA